MTDPDNQLIYRGRGKVHAERVRVECHVSPESFTVRVGSDAFQVSRVTGRVSSVRRAPAESAQDPAFLLSLAVRGLFSLHSGAVSTPAGVVAFIGRSGAGKSTLSSFLGSREEAPWPLVSDDILPVDFGRRPPQVAIGALHKGPSSDQRWLPLRAVYVLRSWRRPHVRSRRLPPREAVVAMIRQSVATRLFDASLRAEHLDACVNAAASIPVSELHYPRDYARLEDVRAALARDLGLG